MLVANSLRADTSVRGSGATCNLRRNSCCCSARFFRRQSIHFGGQKTPWDSQGLLKGSWLLMGTRTEMVAQLSCMASPVSQASQGDREEVAEDQVPPSPEPPSEPKVLIGTAIMFAVALMWGTNPVCTRFLYLSTDPPSSAVLGAVQATVSAIFLGLLLCVQRWQGGPDWGAPIQECRPVLEDGARLLGHEAQIQPLQRDPDEVAGPATSLREAGLPSWVNFGQHPVPVPNQVFLAGAEIGTWAFAANYATLMGFSMTSATTGAFVLRLTVIFTPICSLLLAANPPPWLSWAAAVLALLGGLVLGLDKSNSSGGPLQSDGLDGVILILVAAALWSVQTVRQGQAVARWPPLPLAVASMGTLAALSLVWFGSAAISAVLYGQSLSTLWRGYGDPLSWAVMLWPAIGPWGLGTVLQMVGQQSVSPTQAQLILATDPLWATLFAGVLGASERDLTQTGWIGVSIILTACIVGSFSGGSKAH